MTVSVFGDTELYGCLLKSQSRETQFSTADDRYARVRSAF